MAAKKPPVFAESPTPRNLPDAAFENQFMVRAGQNLPNHSLARVGLEKFVAFSDVQGNVTIVLRTRQEVYRLVAWLLSVADAHALPDELPIDPGTHMILERTDPYSYEEIEAHVHNS